MYPLVNIYISKVIFENILVDVFKFNVIISKCIYIYDLMMDNFINLLSIKNTMRFKVVHSKLYSSYKELCAQESNMILVQTKLGKLWVELWLKIERQKSNVNRTTKINLPLEEENYLRPQDLKILYQRV